MTEKQPGCLGTSPDHFEDGVCECNCRTCCDETGCLCLCPDCDVEACGIHVAPAPAETPKLTDRVAAVLAIDPADHATKSRDYGRGYAEALRQVHEMLDPTTAGDAA